MLKDQEEQNFLYWASNDYNEEWRTQSFNDHILKAI